MLIIRAAQLAEIARAGEPDTERRALSHLRQAIPKVCAALSEQELLDVIRWGRRRSAYYGIQAEYDFFRYLNLMFVFGFSFDTSTPWAGNILAGSLKSGPKMDLLMDRALLECSRNSGKGAQ